MLDCVPLKSEEIAQKWPLTAFGLVQCAGSIVLLLTVMNSFSSVTLNAEKDTGRFQLKLRLDPPALFTTINPAVLLYAQSAVRKWPLFSKPRLYIIACRSSKMQSLVKMARTLFRLRFE